MHSWAGLTTQAALYTHHQYIAGFLMVGAFAHVFWVRDYDSDQNKGNVLDRVLKHKEAIISHLSWVSLGFHTLGLRPQRCGCLQGRRKSKS